MIAPRITRKPIAPIVLPKPSFIWVIIVCAGRVKKARNKETRSSATKELSLIFEVRTIIPMILTITKDNVSR